MCIESDEEETRKKIDNFSFSFGIGFSQRKKNVARSQFLAFALVNQEIERERESIRTPVHSVQLCF